MTIPSYSDLYCTRLGCPKYLPWCDVEEVRRGVPFNSPDCATTWIEVDDDVFVELEMKTVCEHDWEGDEYRPLTAADIKRYGLEDAFYPEDYDDETGELITDWDDYWK